MERLQRVCKGQAGQSYSFEKGHRWRSTTQPEPHLSHLEERVASLMGEVGAAGQESVSESRITDGTEEVSIFL